MSNDYNEVSNTSLSNTKAGNIEEVNYIIELSKREKWYLKLEQENTNQLANAKYCNLWALTGIALAISWWIIGKRRADSYHTHEHRVKALQKELEACKEEQNLHMITSLYKNMI